MCNYINLKKPNNDETTIDLRNLYLFTSKSKSFRSLGLIVSFTLFAILVKLIGFGLLAVGAFTSADFDITSSTMRRAEHVKMLCLAGFFLPKNNHVFVVHQV